MEAPSSYLTYVIFVENCLFLALKLTTILAMGALLHALRFRPQRLRVKHISVAMFAYLGTHLTFSLLTLPYFVYGIFWWQRPPSRRSPPGSPAGIFAPQTLFWLTLPHLAYVTTAPMPVFFLTLDRISALKPTQAIGHHRNSISIFGGCLTLAVYVLFVVGWVVQELPLRLDFVAFCETGPCLMLATHGVIQLLAKLVFGTANVASCVAFMMMLGQLPTASNMKNRVVKFSMACEIVLDLVPAYCAFFYNWLIGVTLANYAGDVVSLLMSASAAACGVYYWRIFQAKPPISNHKKATTIRTTVVAAVGVLRQPPADAGNNSARATPFGSQRQNHRNHEENGWPPPQAKNRREREETSGFRHATSYGVIPPMEMQLPRVTG